MAEDNEAERPLETRRSLVTRRSPLSRGSWAAPAFLLVVVIGQLWPMTLLGRQPVGGDATGFFYPLMAYYCRALADRRVPLWNELWGFGFPGLAESQMG